MMMKRGDEREIPAGSMRAINHDLPVSFCFPRELQATRPPGYTCAADAAAAGDGEGDGGARVAPAHGHIC